VDLLPLIADERRRVARLVEGLSQQQLATASLCTEWTVHEVAAHLLSPLVTPLPKALFMLVISGFNVDRLNRRLTASVARLSPQEIVDGLRERAGHPFKPPRMGFEAPLVDLLVHQQDIRRPLGFSPDLVPERLMLCLGIVAKLTERSSILGTRGCLEGLRVEATDLDWGYGEGLVVRAPGEALLMALSGRTAALPDLDGEGADLLRSRLIH
jgi:uncharacterized protein (TIGR03083 family)